MKLPSIKSTGTKSTKLLINNKYKILPENSPSKDHRIDTFIKRLNEVNELQIYLTSNFNAYDIDEAFIKDMELEYAEQYLNKLEMLPTKNLIRRILNLRPLEKCDFYLSNEFILNNGVEKQMKLVYIYPNSQTHNSKKRLDTKENKQNNLKKYFSENIQSAIKMKKSYENKQLKEKIISIKKNNKNELDQLIYNKDKIDEIINKDLDDIAELKLYSKKNSVNVDLSFENIKKKYIIIKKIEDYQTNEKIFNCKGKFYNISKSISGQKNLLNDPKYSFDITEIKDLNNDIIKEVSEPLDVQLELVMKDLNYILDNFPMDKFINIDGDINSNKNQKSKTKIINTPLRYNSQRNNKIYKLTLDKQEDIIKICKILHSIDFSRLVCLTLNLVYWIVFGNQNNVQIDQNTKEYLYLKILNQIDIINSKVPNIKLLSKIFIPLEIILIRIEMDNYLNRKFILLFDEEKSPHNKEKVMTKVNNIITEIFDKHGYMNSFETIFGSRDDLNKKISNNYFPRFKGKIFATGNMIEQLFNNDKNDIVKSNNIDNVVQRQEFLLGPKVDFFSSYLTKINNNLKKRNLAPIFSLSNNQSKPGNKQSDEIIDKNFKRDLYLKTDNNNERYDNVEQYIDNASKRLNGLILKPIHISKSTVAKTEITRQKSK